MSKTSVNRKKVSLDELSHHAITNKRQVMKDMKMQESKCVFTQDI